MTDNTTREEEKSESFVRLSVIFSFEFYHSKSGLVFQG